MLSLDDVKGGTLGAVLVEDGRLASLQRFNAGKGQRGIGIDASKHAFLVWSQTLKRLHTMRRDGVDLADACVVDACWGLGVWKSMHLGKKLRAV